MQNKIKEDAIRKFDTQFATSMTADFEENTWTFLMPDKYEVWAGQFAIVDKQVYDEMIEKISRYESPTLSIKDGKEEMEGTTPTGANTVTNWNDVE